MASRLSTAPECIVQGFGHQSSTGGTYGGAMPRLFSFGSTATSTGITGTGFLAGHGEGGRTNRNVGLRVGDIVLHVASTDSATPGRVTFHSVIGSTWNQASTSASSAWNVNAGYDCSLSASTS